MSKRAEFRTDLHRSCTKFAIGAAALVSWVLFSSAAAILGPQIITTSLPSGSEGSFYSFQLAASGGQAPYTWSLTPLSTPLPRGLTLSPSGLLSGTPTSAGLFRPSFRVTDRALGQDEASLSLTINSAAASAATGYGVLKTIEFLQSSAGPPTLYPVSSFAFFAYVHESAPGSILAASFRRPDNSTQNLELDPGDPEWNIDQFFSTKPAFDAAFPAGTYSFTIQTADGIHPLPPVNLTADNYPPPPHLLNFPAAQAIDPSSDFVLSWEPFPGVTENDNSGLNIRNRAGDVIINLPALSMGATSITIPAHALQPGQTYSGFLWFTKVVSAEATLPAGVAAYSSATSFSLATKGGSNQFAIVTDRLPARFLGLPYHAQLETGNGAPPVQWAVTQGNLPKGLNLDPLNGTIDGFPQVLGRFEFTVRATDGGGQNASRLLSILIDPPPDGTPIATTPAPEYATGTGSDGTNYLIVIQGDEIDDLNLSVQLLSPIGSPLAPRLLLGRTGTAPQVSFDGNNYLVVWEDNAASPDDDIYGALVSRAGVLVAPPFPIVIAPGKQELARLGAIAFDGTRHLLVWHTNGRGVAPTGLYGQFISPNGALSGPQMLIGPDDLMAEYGVGFGQNRYLVAWMPLRGAAPELYDVKGRFLSAAGLDGDPFLISQTPSPIHNPIDIGFNQNFLVAWTRGTGLSFSNGAAGDLYARVVPPSGVLTAPEFPVSTGANLQIIPLIVPDGPSLLLSWLEFRGATPVTKSRLFTPQGLPLGADFISASNAGSRVPLSFPISNGRGLLLVTSWALLGSNDLSEFRFSDGDVYAKVLTSTAAALTIKPSALPAGNVNESYLARFEAQNGTAPFTWSVVSNSLPPGLSLDASSGVVKGTPAFEGTFNFSVRVSDGGGHQDDESFDLVILPAETGFRIAAAAGAIGTFGGATDGSNFLASFQTASGVGAQLIALTGESIGPPVIINRRANLPLASFGGRNYLLVWSDFNGAGPGQIFGQFISNRGEAVGDPFPISAGVSITALEAIAFNGQNFLVTWNQRPVNGASIAPGLNLPVVMGRFVSPAGVFAGPEFQISDGPGFQSQVIFNGAEYLAVWNSLAVGGDRQIEARLISPAGELRTPFVINTNAFLDEWSAGALSFDGANCLLVWPGSKAGALDGRADLLGQFISRAGTLVGPSFTINRGTGAQLRPFVAFDGLNYLVLWTDTRNDLNHDLSCDPNEKSCLDIAGQFVSKSGQLLGTAFPVAADSGNQAISPVIYCAGNYLALWASGTSSKPFQVDDFNTTELRGTILKRLGPTFLPSARAATVAAGNDATLTADVVGEEPLFYQWQFHGTNLPGQTNITLVLTNVTAADAGFYTLVVSNAAGVSSTLINLVTLDPPVITTQPTGGAVTTGAGITLQVGASGSPPLRYRWRLNGVNIPGATGSTLVLTNLQPTNSGVYSVIVANGAGAVSSDPARVKVTSGPIAAALLTDNFSARFVTNNSVKGTVLGDNSAATPEPGEPNHDGKRGGKSVWFSWVAPGGGTARFNTRGSSFDTLLGVYTGNAVGALTRITSDDDQGDFFTSAVTFKAFDGVAYQIAVDGRGGASGDVVLNWDFEFGVEDIPQFISQPRSQTVVPGSDAQLSAGIAVADEARTRPALTYQWFKDGALLPGANDTNLLILNFQQANVGTYRIVVTNTAINKFFLSDPAVLELGPAPAPTASQDKFEDVIADLANNSPGLELATVRRRAFASVAAGTLGTQTMDNFGSTTEPGEPNHGGVIGGASRWFALVPQTNGIMIVDTIGSDIDTVLAIYRGSDLLNLTEVASNDNGAPDGIRSLVKFNAKKGTNYLVAVDGVNGAQGNIQLNFKLGTAPAFTQKPEAKSVVGGGTVSLSAVALAIPTPAFQWRLNGIDLFGATNAVLTLQNFQEGNAGTYKVVVSNFAGTTNATATVTLIQPVTLAGALNGNGAFTLQLVGAPGQTYVLQSSADLLQWAPVMTNTPPSGAFSFVDAQSSNLPYRFYRAFILP